MQYLDARSEVGILQSTVRIFVRVDYVKYDRMPLIARAAFRIVKRTVEITRVMTQRASVRRRGFEPNLPLRAVVFVDPADQ